MKIIHAQHRRMLRQTLFVMKITAFLLLISIMTVSAATLAQQITLKTKNASLEEVFEKLHQQTGYDILCASNLLTGARPVTVDLKNTDLKDALAAIFNGQPLDYSIEDRSVVIKEKETSLLGNLKEKVKALIANIDIRGRVVDESGQPLPGATVAVKGTSNVTATDVNGYFTLRNVDPNATIVLTSIGYEKQELPAKTEMGTLKMKTAQSKLDEVQVIAYGQTTQRLTVGNIGSVSSKQIEQQPVANPLLTLEGRVPGLFITEKSGIAGGGVTVRVQGQNSIANGNDPFYVIDGVPYTATFPKTVLGANTGALSGGSPLTYINPDDIESISILKDAAATAIYGTRAANGAILITTKKGKAGETKVDINLQQGWGQPDHSLDLMNTQQYLQMRYEAMRNDALITIPSTSYDLNGLWNQNNSTNWQKVLIGSTAHFDDYHASISGGSANTQYLVGGTFHHETSVFPGDFADNKGAVNVSINTASTNNKFHLQFSGNFLTDNNTLPGTSVTDFTNLAVQTAPDAPPLYKADGTLNWAPNAAGASSWTNPLAKTLSPYQSKTTNLIANAVASYEIVKGLELKSSFGYTNLQVNETNLGLLTALAPESRATATRIANYTDNNINSWIAEPQIHFVSTLGNGKLDILLGGTIQQQNTNGLQLLGSGYNSDAVLKDPHSATTLTVQNSQITPYKYEAGFLRINYNWKDKYILDLTANRDGSSRFGQNNQFHDFASAGFAWLFSEEQFIKNKLGFLSLGKLRGSYGTTGNDQIGDYTYLNLYNPVSQTIPYQNSTALTVAGLPNPYLQWELTKKLQIGTDLAFLHDRIVFTANYAYNRSSNELLRYTLPSFVGFNAILENFPATIQNSDWEFLINTINIKKDGFSWSSSFNLTIPQNKVVSFPDIAASSYASGTNGVIVGQPLGVIKTYNYLGVDPGTGNYVFKDSQGNPTMNPNPSTDMTALVSTLPKLYGGLSNNFTYKRFSMDVFLQFVKQKGPGYYFGYIPGYPKANEPVSVLGRWQQPGDVTSIQRYSSNLANYTQQGDVNQSNAFYSDASFIRLKNVSLSYQLPTAWQHKLNLKSCRIYMQGQNLLTFTRFQGMDPESQTVTNLPPLRIISVGIQVGL